MDIHLRVVLASYLVVFGGLTCLIGIWLVPALLVRSMLLVYVILSIVKFYKILVSQKW